MFENDADSKEELTTLILELLRVNGTPLMDISLDLSPRDLSYKTFFSLSTASVNCFMHSFDEKIYQIIEMLKINLVLQILESMS